MFYGAPVTQPMEIPPEVYSSPNAPELPGLPEMPELVDAKTKGLRLQGTVFTESTQIKINVKRKHKILMSLPVKNYGNIEVATRGAKKWINIYNENS